MGWKLTDIARHTNSVEMHLPQPDRPLKLYRTYTTASTNWHCYYVYFYELSIEYYWQSAKTLLFTLNRSHILGSIQLL